MYTWIAVFGVGALGVLAIFGLKVFELKKGESLIGGKWMESSDKAMGAFIDVLRDRDIRVSFWRRVIKKIGRAYYRVKSAFSRS